MARLPDEFEIIRRYFAPLTAGAPGAVGLRDDAATLAVPPDAELIVTADALVAGVHFLPDDPADHIAKKALRVNLSDVAAKGGRPTVYFITLALGPDTDEAWIASFARGLAEDQRAYGVSLAGGDTTATPGPLSISVTAMGEVPRGRVLRRGGARAGDDLYVSGTIGDAALGLAVAKGEMAALESADRAFLLDRYRLPRPRTTMGFRLIGLASGALDISDGLVADLDHLAEASGVAAELDALRVPLSAAARAAIGVDPGLMAQVLTGGDDYEILFSAPAGAAAGLETVARETGIGLTRIGRLASGRGVAIRGADGLALGRGGYRHF
jgi:thiamine-monophosphate kinase